MTNTDWQTFTQTYFVDPKTNFAFDFSQMSYDLKTLKTLDTKLEDAILQMKQLENGSIANLDEKRMVGHYWLRASELAPTVEIKKEIDDNFNNIIKFVADVHKGTIKPEFTAHFKHLLIIGIGGSALGPQLAVQALQSEETKMTAHFFDNTDPEGMYETLRKIPDLKETLCLVISKSGGTKETRNGQLIARAAFENRGLDPNKAFVAVTCKDSILDKTAKNESWLARFPMWDWVGGRTSLFSAVGLLPLALIGFDVKKLCDGAKHMDNMTRSKDWQENPAAIMAALWYLATNGKGEKAMVILPYRDRLELMSKYLQQLVMESLGKEHDRDGKVVEQGLTVYGNKGATDQHAYIQQLRDGLNNFFVVFIKVLKDFYTPHSENDMSAIQFEVEKNVTAGDYLLGLHLGTRSALTEKNRKNITITLEEINEFSIGMLIALFERSVGLYAELININAYHQPGVEAGKKAAQAILDLQLEILKCLEEKPGQLSTVDQIAISLNKSDKKESIFHILQHLAANKRISCEKAKTVFDCRYGAS